MLPYDPAGPLTLNQIAIRTGLPRAWLRERTLAGEIPCLRVGQVWLYDPDAVRKALSRLAATSKAEPEVANA
jgi:hypothetical protein